MKKRVDLRSISGITVNNVSNEFILHFKLLENDSYYSSPRRNEIISTIAEAYYKYTNSKLLFSNVRKEPLKNYVTHTKNKSEDEAYTLMKKDNTCYIEDILNSNKSKNEKKTDDDKAKIEDNEKEKKLGYNLIEFNEKNNYDLYAVSDKNPFSTALIGGAIATGAGMTAAGGSIAACIVFDSKFLMSTAGEVFAAGFAFLGGIAFPGIGIVVVVPSLLGLGAYKLYKMNKENKRKEFFKDFEEAKMKTEKEVYLFAINKIDNYFNEYISDDDEETLAKIINIQNYICLIINKYIDIGNNRFNSSVELIKNDNNQDKIEELIKMINDEITITLKNIAKIRSELMRTLTSSANTDIKKIFDEGIPYFKEFIKIFGPLRIDEENEKFINEKIEKLIQEMKWILENKMNDGFKNFNSKKFLNSFEDYLKEQYKEKHNYDIDITQKTFINNCNDFLIQPIADKSMYYGVLSLYFKFAKIILDIAVRLKDMNYNNNKEKLQNIKQISKRDEIFRTNTMKKNIPVKEKEYIPSSNTMKIQNTNQLNKDLDIPPCLPVNMPNMIPGYMPNMIQENMPNMTPGYMPNMIQENMLNMIPGNMPNMIPGYMPNMIQENMPNMIQENMPNMIPGNMPNIIPINPMINSQKNIVPLYNQAPLANNYNNINNFDDNNNNNSQISKKHEFLSLPFIIIEKNKENLQILVQVTNEMSIKNTINNFKTKMCCDISFFKKYLIDDKIELDPSSEETLQAKGINEHTKIMAYKE